MPLTIANSLPQGMTYTFSQNPMNGPDSSVLTIHVLRPVVPSSWYPIIYPIVLRVRSCKPWCIMYG